VDNYAPINERAWCAGGDDDRDASRRDTRCRCRQHVRRMGLGGVIVSGVVVVIVIIERSTGKKQTVQR
jgi:hypothetical protein